MNKKLYVDKICVKFSLNLSFNYSTIVFIGMKLLSFHRYLHYINEIKFVFISCFFLTESMVNFQEHYQN